ncbi:MAG: transporter substrate-binding domain-containing protein [Synergistaceae bacterium]|nr:transporter substrate-binding domain-containing protein [Synergistaceae bacterium]
MKKIGLLSVLSVVSLLVFSHGGGIASAASEGSNVRVVQVATAPGSSKPWSYYDEKGEIIGYDIDVLKEVDNRISDVEFNWNAVEFASAFLGVDSGRYQMIVNNINKNAEREEKYLFSDNSYLTSSLVITSKNGDYKSLSDLAGKSLISDADGSNVQLLAEAYNKAHSDKPINIVYTKASMSERMQGIEQGRYDAAVTNLLIVSDYNKEFGGKLKYVKLPEAEQAGQASKVYVLFVKNETELKAKIDKALQSMADDGTLTKISLQYFGVDLSK